MCERELENKQNCNILTPHSYSSQRCVFLVLQGCSTGGSKAQLSAGCWLSLPHLVTKLSDLQTGLQTKWLPVFTELYNSSIAHSIFGMACLIVIKQKSLSCSSQVTLFRCISLWLYRGILPCPILTAKPTYAISSHNCHRNVSLPLSLEWHVWPGRRSIYNTVLLGEWFWH